MWEEKDGVQDDERALLSGPTIHERQAAAAAVAGLGDRAAIPQLIRLLDDRNPHGRIAAVKALVELEATEALAAVERTVDQESTWTQKTLTALKDQLRKIVA